MKRKHTNNIHDNESISSRTRTKRKGQCTEWISATKVRNYMLNDSLVDWLEEHYYPKSLSPIIKTDVKYHREDSKNFNFNFSKFIMEKGIDFENNLIEYINNIGIPVITVSNTITDDSVQETIKLMKDGVFIIHSAPVRNYTNNTHGIIDLLVRSDFIHKLVEECPLTEDEIKTPSYWSSDGSKYSKPYHYIVIDIKFSTLPLRADGKHLLNSSSYPAYKAQCLIYTQAIGLIQGYTSNYAFILGRRWKYTQKVVQYNNYTCLNKLGVIDYKTVDKSYIKRTNDALEWTINNKKNGSKWSVSPPSCIELYPNMSRDSGKWQKEKEKIAYDIGEISNVWYCGWQHRNIGISKGIKSWRDPKCTSENIGIKGSRASIIDSILDINRQSIDKIRPKKIKNNLLKWKSEKHEMFVDFETLSDIFSSFTDLHNQKQTDMVFMIGVYWKPKPKSEWEYKSFIAKEASHDEEYRIMNEFNIFVKEQGNPKLWHWYADSFFCKKSENKLYDMSITLKQKHKIENISNNWIQKNWADMGEIFKHEPIVIKGCFKFGLKAIATAMKDNGLINTTMDSICNSGMNAMIAAYNLYCESDVENPLESDVMKDIQKYNKFDCQVLYDILTYLRKNHS